MTALVLVAASLAALSIAIMFWQRTRKMDRMGRARSIDAPWGQCNEKPMKTAAPTSSPDSVELNAGLIDEHFSHATSAAPRTPREDLLHAQDEAALADWESDGGRTIAVPRGCDNEGDSRWPPRLAPGHTSQPVLGFHNNTRYSYEFNRVYGPPTRRDRRGPVCLQDENCSYWCVTWSVIDDTGHGRLKGRSMTYAQARQLLGSRMTFDRFSSLRAELPDLLGVGRSANPSD